MPEIPANLIEREGTWDAQVFVGLYMPVLDLPTANVVSAEMASIFEGQRWEESRVAGEPVYRLSNIGELEFRLDPEHFAAPSFAQDRCVAPCDVIVSKVSPVRAALVSSGVFRHAVDANCYMVRGLDLALGFWFALCVNQPAFGEYLVGKSGAAIVPRVRADVLGSARFPRPPVGIERLSHQVYECLDRRLESQLDLVRFLSTVREQIAATVPDSSRSGEDNPRAAAPWHRFFKPSDIGDSWVPGHVAINGYQIRLMRDAGWRSIRNLTSTNGWGGDRIGVTDSSNQNIRTLQLSDVGDDLTVLRGEVRPDVAAGRRVYAEPLHENEVLLSALVSRSRVAFIGRKPDAAIHPTDHWHRLHFRETPGAWALVLADPVIHEQLSRLAIGTVQQFAPLWTIHRLVLPDIPLEIRIKWDTFLRRWQQRRLQLEDEWVGLMKQAYGFLLETHRECGPWTQPPAALRGEESKR